jgi:hypothetical protein
MLRELLSDNREPCQNPMTLKTIVTAWASLQIAVQIIS